MNIWHQLKSLFPEEPIRIGTVLTIRQATGASTLRLLDGAIITARGTSIPVGHKAFVRAGLIEGPAPSLPEISVEI